MTNSTNMKRSLMAVACTACIAIGAGVSPIHAATFSGKDAGVNGSGARPNSDTAASQFDAAAGALGTINLINFESLTLGSLSSSTSFPKVTILGKANNYISDGTDFDIPSAPVVGFNTTSGGSKFLRTWNFDTVTFKFVDPIQAFGAYITGLGTRRGDVMLQFNDGSSQSYNLSNILRNGSVGGASFFGFTEAGKSISSVSFAEMTGNRDDGADLYGIDDVRFVSSSQPIPTPALLPGLMGIGLGVWRKRKGESAKQEAKV
jgi:hypothetical protein